MSLKGFFTLKTSDEDGSTNLYDVTPYVLDGDTSRNFGYELGYLEVKLAKKQSGTALDFTKIAQNKRIRLWKGYWATPGDQTIIAISTDTGGANLYNESTAAGDATTNDMNLMKNPVGTGDFYAFGAAKKFSGVRVNVSTAGVGTYTVTWQYSSGVDGSGYVNSWTNLGSNLIGNAQNFKRAQNTVQRFSMPTDWTAGKLTTGTGDTATAYFVRALYTITSITTLPLGKQAFIIDTRQFDGYITEVHNIDDNTVLVKAYDRLLKAKEAKGGVSGIYTLSDYSTTTDASTIVGDIITFINNTKSVSLSYTIFPDALSITSTFNVNVLRLQGFTLYERLQILGLYENTAGQVWQVFYSPEEDLVHFEPRFGFANSTVINYDNGVFINQRPNWEEDKLSIVNSVLVIGKTSSITATSSNAGHQSTYGLVERRWNRPDIEDATDIQNTADRLLDVFTYYFDFDASRTFGKTVKVTIPHVDTYGFDLNQRVEVNDQYPTDTAKDMRLRIERMNIPITQPIINMVLSNRHPFAVSPEISNADRIEKLEYRTSTSLAGGGAGSGINLVYYLQNTASDIATYLKLLLTPYTPKTTLSTASVTNGQVLKNFATDPSNPNLTFIPAGPYEFHIHAAKTAGTKTAQIYVDIWEVDSTGVDIVKIGTTEITPALTSSELEYSLFFINANVHNLASTASRIVTRVTATITGSGTAPTIAIYYGGTADSHLSLPAGTTIDFIAGSGCSGSVTQPTVECSPVGSPCEVRITVGKGGKLRILESA